MILGCSAFGSHDSRFSLPPRPHLNQDAGSSRREGGGEGKTDRVCSGVFASGLCQPSRFEMRCTCVSTPMPALIPIAWRNSWAEKWDVRCPADASLIDRP
mgnify:CR=1 FL=1